MRGEEGGPGAAVVALDARARTEHGDAAIGERIRRSALGHQQRGARIPRQVPGVLGELADQEDGVSILERDRHERAVGVALRIDGQRAQRACRDLRDQGSRALRVRGRRNVDVVQRLRRVARGPRVCIFAHGFPAPDYPPRTQVARRHVLRARADRARGHPARVATETSCSVASGAPSTAQECRRSSLAAGHGSERPATSLRMSSAASAPPAAASAAADQHGGAEAAREDGGVEVRVAGQAGESWNHRDGHQPGAPRDRVVDAGGDAGVPLRGAGKHGGGQRRHGQREPEAEHHHSRQHRADIGRIPACTRLSSARPAAMHRGPTVIGRRGPIRSASMPARADRRSMRPVTGSVASPACMGE